MRSYCLIELSGCYGQQSFWQKEQTDLVHRLDCSDIQGSLYFCSEEAQAELRRRLKTLPLHSLHFIDSGDYHYLTLFFLERIKEPFSLLLFDHHSDCMESAFGGSLLTCGSWVLHALRRLPMLKKVILAGPADEDGTAELLSGDERILWLTEEELPEHMEQLEKDLQLYPVYLSLDKDVLSAAEAATDWSQGNMTLDGIFEVVKLLKPSRLLGMDVCGEQRPDEDFAEAARVNSRSNERIVNFQKDWTFLV